MTSFHSRHIEACAPTVVRSKTRIAEADLPQLTSACTRFKQIGTTRLFAQYKRNALQYKKVRNHPQARKGDGGCTATLSYHLPLGEPLPTLSCNVVGEFVRPRPIQG